MRIRAMLAAAAVALTPAAAEAFCVEIRAGADWQEIAVDGPILDVHARGLWTADTEALRKVGPLGHPAEAGEGAERVAPPYPLGALLLASGARRVWSYRDFQRTAMGAMLAGKAFVVPGLYARINDAEDGLGDNAGSITLCIELAAE